MILTEDIWNSLLILLAKYHLNRYYKVHVIAKHGFQLRIHMDKNHNFESAEIRNVIGQPYPIENKYMNLIIEVMHHKKENDD